MELVVKFAVTGHINIYARDIASTYINIRNMSYNYIKTYNTTGYNIDQVRLTILDGSGYTLILCSLILPMTVNCRS
jgi:hypothetical protein